MPQADAWECEDVEGRVRPEKAKNLVGTTWDDYLILERYVDSKEKRVRDLERQLAQCR